MVFELLHFLFSFFKRDILFLSVIGMLFFWLFYIGLHRHNSECLMSLILEVYIVHHVIMDIFLDT